MDQTLRNMRGHSTIAQILIILVSSTGSFRIRKTLQAWHTSATKHANNNSEPIPNQYNILFKQQSCFWSSSYFYLAFSCIYFIILHSIFYPSKAVDRQLKAHVLFCFCFFQLANVFIIILIMHVSSWLRFNLYFTLVAFSSPVKFSKSVFPV